MPIQEVSKEIKMQHFHAVKQGFSWIVQKEKKNISEFLHGQTKPYIASVKEMISGVTITPNTCWSVWEISLAPHWDHKSVKRSKLIFKIVTQLNHTSRSHWATKRRFRSQSISVSENWLWNTTELSWKSWYKVDTVEAEGRSEVRYMCSMGLYALGGLHPSCLAALRSNLSTQNESIASD